MGYKRKPKVYRLHFEDDDMSGLIVEVRPSSVGTMLDTADLASMASVFDGISMKNIRPEDLEKIGELRKLFDSFADSLVSWNLEDEDDNPVPATREGVYGQDVDFILEIIGAWAEAVGGVNEDTKAESSNGLPSQVALLPMEPLSANQGN